ncbi:Telomere length regulation protein TEL2-like protein, partial [Stegodyphus mimosarum]
MEGNATRDASAEIHNLCLEIKDAFNARSEDAELKWSLLKKYKLKYLPESHNNQVFISSYYSVLSVLLDALKPILFAEKWQEKLFDDIFLGGVHHEAFMILARRLNETCESYEQEKILMLLQVFLKSSSIDSMLHFQCVNSEVWDLKCVASSKMWDDLITLMVSLPERIANKTKGQMNKIFGVNFYVPLLASSVLKVLGQLHEKIISCDQDCSLEFLAKLIGKLCVVGHATIIAKKFSVEFIKCCESDYVWRRMAQHLIRKMPTASLESFITNMLLVIPWYGYVDWILGDEGVKIEKLNFIMTVKLFLMRCFQSDLILQNIIGYFASSDSRISSFWKIFDTLLSSWSDASTLKYQSFQQQKYIASALIVCAGWLKLKGNTNRKVHLDKVLHGTHIRIASSEASVRNLGMIVGDKLISAIDPEAPKLEFEHTDTKLVNCAENLIEIPHKPGKDSFISIEDLKCFEIVEQEKTSWSQCDDAKAQNATIHTMVDSDEELEPYDMSHDVPLEETKRPLYIRDCMMGLLEQENSDWTEQCLKHAEHLIKMNSDTVHEIAVEMTKIVLHMEDKYSIPDFISLRHRILCALIVECPILVAEYLTSQFCEKDYNIRQRLDILEVLAASSQILSRPDVKVSSTNLPNPKEKFEVTTEKQWKVIIDQRIEAKSRHITKTPRKPLPEPQVNRFSAVAGYFFYPLLEKYDRQNNLLKLFGEDSYVLGRLIYTLGIIMHSASNIPLCDKMGRAMLQFLKSVRN